MNSRAKGARVEREAAAFLTSIGFPAERNARNGKSADDIVCKSLPGVHFEVKGNEAIDIGTALLDDACIQACQDSNGRFPVVLWKRSRRGWRLTFVCSKHAHWATIEQTDIKDFLIGFRNDAGKE